MFSCSIGRLLLASAATSLVFISGAPVQAAESGTGFYLLGSKNTMAGVVPPSGFYINSETYFYSGKAGAGITLPQGGKLALGLNADVVLEVPTALWVIPQQVLGGNLGFGVSMPFGFADVSAALEITSLGLKFGTQDDIFTLGDPVMLATLGWSNGPFFWNVHTLVNVPIGDYDKGSLANIAFNRWAVDLGGSVTWLDVATGFELSSSLGFTFNGENPSTNYKTGTEFHVEFAAMKHLSQALSFGIVGYHYEQISGDSGKGATLGGFKGRTTALGGIVSVNTLIGTTPVNIKARVYQEFDVKNRLEATTGFLSVAFPL